MWCGLYGFLIIKPQTALHHVMQCGAVRCTITYGVMRLCHFAMVYVQFVRFGN